MKKNVLEKKSRTPSSTVETQNNLLPCPFCGDAHVTVSEYDSKDAWWTQCDNIYCGAEGPPRKTEDDARIAWNQRATSSVGDGSGSDTASFSQNPVCCPAHQDLVEALKLAAQQLEDLTPIHLNWHLFTGEIARSLRAALSKAGEA